MYHRFSSSSERLVLDVIVFFRRKNNWCFQKDSISSGSISSQSRPSSHIERGPTPVSTPDRDEPEDVKANHTAVDIPEGHVKNKIKQVIEEQVDSLL